MIVTSNPKRSRKKIDDIVTWMEAFSIYTTILTSYFPHRWNDLSPYKLLIYDRAFRENAEGVAARGRSGDLAGAFELPGNTLLLSNAGLGIVDVALLHHDPVALHTPAQPVRGTSGLVCVVASSTRQQIFIRHS